MTPVSYARALFAALAAAVLGENRTHWLAAIEDVAVILAGGDPPEIPSAPELRLVRP